MKWRMTLLVRSGAAISLLATANGTKLRKPQCKNFARPRSTGFKLHELDETAMSWLAYSVVDGRE